MELCSVGPEVITRRMLVEGASGGKSRLILLAIDHGGNIAPCASVSN